MVTFDYARTPAADWASSIKDFKTSNVSKVVIPIYWGDHETLQGVRDFHTKSRLKLEKVLSLAQAEGLPLEVRFCLSGQDRSFPDWMKGVAKKNRIQSIGPQLWFSPWEFCEVPDIQSEGVQESFFGFVEEALSILALYCDLQSVVTAIRFELGGVSQQLSDPDGSKFQRHLETRYSNIQKLNQTFLTNFKDFSGATKPIGIKTLLNKRPWLLVWEYQTMKKRFVADWNQQLQSLLAKHQIQISIENKHNEVIPTVETVSVIDDTFLELDGLNQGFGPVLISGELEPAVISYFRETDLAFSKARAQSQRVEWLRQWDHSLPKQHYLFWAHQFFPRSAYQKITQLVLAGSKVSFAGTIPKWDENMEFLDWKNIL